MISASAPKLRLIYVAPLRPGRGRDAFRSRWEQHGARAMKLPNWSDLHGLYKQCDAVVTELDVAALVGFPPIEGSAGVAMVRIYTEGDIFRAFSEQDIADILADEVETFGRTLGSDLRRAHQVDIVEGPAPAFTLVALLYRSGGVDRGEFSDRWAASADTARVPELVSHVANHIQGGDDDDYDGMLELGFASLEDLQAVFARDSSREDLLGAAGRFVDASRTRVLLVRERVIHDPPARP